MQEFKVPELGENVEQGDVTRVLVKVGDTIKKDQSVVELETDKATIEVPSSVAGVVKDIKVKQGDKVKVGAVIFTVDDAASGNGAGGAAKDTEAAAKAATAPEGEAAKGTEDRFDAASRATARGTRSHRRRSHKRRLRRLRRLRRDRRLPQPLPFAASRVKLASTSMTSRAPDQRGASRTKTSRSTRAAS
jgi:pyruvate/2-oxoglutarate dehydrogenase complex dihydrolipoamide acyltransferase (E2) component